MSEDNISAKDIVEATVTGAMKSAPVYQDLAQPSMQVVGMETARLISALFVGIRATAWTVEKLEHWYYRTVGPLLSDIPQERLQTPDQALLGAVMEALCFSAGASSVSDLFAKLLATSMDKETAEYSHPAFVDMIRHMTPDEARLMQLFFLHGTYPVISIASVSMDDSGLSLILRNFTSLSAYDDDDNTLDSPHLIPGYLDNLCRLGLIDIPDQWLYSHPEQYGKIGQHPTVIAAVETANSIKGCFSKVSYTMASLTNLGEQFRLACIEPHDQLVKAKEAATK